MWEGGKKHQGGELRSTLTCYFKSTGCEGEAREEKGRGGEKEKRGKKDGEKNDVVARKTQNYPVEATLKSISENLRGKKISECSVN